MTSSAVAFLPRVIISEWRCMWVVGILIAIVVMLTSGSTVMTSGPWWDGRVTGSGTTASIGPFPVSCGSAALLARTALAFLTPKFVLSA